VLTSEQKAKYEQIRQTAIAELEYIDKEIETELSAVKKRLLQLQEDKKAVKQIYDGASMRLGVASAVTVKDLNLADLTRQAELAKA
jgi:ABC-type Zn uptake system ZnuABC Zn-binding protein ZnuA